MLLKKNLWMIFYALVGLGLAFLVLLNVSYWQSLQQKTNLELTSINNIFSSSVESAFTQQEVLLELLGQQLYRNDFYKEIKSGTALLDRVKSQNKSFVGFGLANLDGELILGSSNVKLDKMPNLRTSEKTKDTFIKSLSNTDLSIGRTYYIKVLDSIVIPIRKSIRDASDQLLGVMTLGVKPQKLLLTLDEMSAMSAAEYSTLLVQDGTFYRLYMTSNDKNEDVNKIIGDPISLKLHEKHIQALFDQTGQSIDDLKTSKQAIEYYAVNHLGVMSQFSVRFIAKFNLWSFVSKPRVLIVDELKRFAMVSAIVFLVIMAILFILFRSISISAAKNRQELLKQANHDFLTGLHNRLFLKYTESNWTADLSKEFSVLFIDLDNFKNINDLYGHNVGDLILQVVANRLRDLFGEGDLICRQGGDEFIVLYQQASFVLVEAKAKQLIESIICPYKIEKYEFVIGASMGISKFPADGDNFESLFSAADSAMYEAKKKNCDFEFYTNELSVKTAHIANIEQALHFALQNKELFMVYQPQIDLNGNLYGVEALVRWKSDVLGFVPPDQFIHIAENSGLILDIGNFVLRQSLSDLSRLCEHSQRTNIQLSINISVRQFVEFNFIDVLQKTLDEFNFPASRLTLEITESIFIDDLDYILPLFNRIRSLGIRLSLDDFGTGFSSLSILKRLPIDELKIDKSFIDPIVDDERDRTMVVNILNIAKSLNLKVVAEGIEDAEQAEILKQHRCDIQQGYFHSHPIKYEDLLKYCRH